MSRAGGRTMPRKMIDCRDSPSVSGCTLTIAGEEEEVVRAAAMHAADVHGHEDNEELRNEIRKSMKDEQPTASSMPSAQPGAQPAPMPH
jgi:predicted small metal-binding protein